jgi:putative PIN family toxin of toxin-antitoxin system
LPAPKAVADTNVWVPAAISPAGVCGRLLQAAIDGRWRAIVSPLLLAELDEVLARPKFRRWLTVDEAHQFVADLRVIADEVDDPTEEPVQRSADPDDDYLVALAGITHADALISGDPHLIHLDLDPPVTTPSAFLHRLSRVTPDK